MSKHLAFIDQLPRWLLVGLAAYGLILLQHRFAQLETSVASHEKELQELRIIAAKLTTIVERR